MGQLLGPGFSFAIELIQCQRRATTVAIEEARRGPGRETDLKSTQSPGLFMCQMKVGSLVMKDKNLICSGLKS